MLAAKSKVLIIPGLFNSGPRHWQSLWQVKHREYVRVIQGDWERPRYDDWITMLDKYVAEASVRFVLVGHSLGCATIANWTVRFNGARKGALLVAPSDPEAATYTFETEGFSTKPKVLVLTRVANRISQACSRSESDSTWF
jgi:predicted alpha/beta hydrolase family esterase